MFWADRIAEEIKTKYAEKISQGEPVVIRDEKTASGRVHVGSLRGVAIHGIISEILTEQGVKNRFLYEINDFDPMDGLPVYLNREKFLPEMGKPLCDVVSPEPGAKNYAEYFGQEFIGVIEGLGFQPEFYRPSDLYRAGKFDGAIKTALENAGKIREIYLRVSGSQKEKDWYPLNVVCESCGKIGTTKISSFDGEKVEYSCEENLVEWAKGCGHKGKVSPFGGKAKLPWKVEWAAKFSVLGVDVEGAGKDHATKGGARDVANAISREVFRREPPLDIPYEHFLVGGKKMSASKGLGSSAKEIADSLPPELLRFLFFSKEPRQAIDFIPDGDTIPVLYDSYDKMAESYFSRAEGDYKRIFSLARPPAQRESIKEKFLPRFSQIAFLVQMPHVDLKAEVEKMAGRKLDRADEEEANYRGRYASNWLKAYAPEDYRFELQSGFPDAAKNLSGGQKEGLKKILEFIKTKEILDGQELHTQIHEIKKEAGISPQEFFSAIYLIFLGKESGPKAGWFLSVLDRDFLIKRLEEATVNR